jgi:hypothetical protein
MENLDEKFNVLIDGEVAFLLEFETTQEAFMNVIKQDPDVVACDHRNVEVEDTYLNGAFLDSSGGQKSAEDLPEDLAKFAFVVDGVVLFTQEIPKSAEMIVAAYSSSPKFVEV